MIEWDRHGKRLGKGGKVVRLHLNIQSEGTSHSITLNKIESANAREQPPFEDKRTAAPVGMVSAQPAPAPSKALRMSVPFQSSPC